MSSYKLSWNNHEVIKVLKRNAIKCLVCNTVIESKHRHHYTQCQCLNEASLKQGSLSCMSGFIGEVISGVLEAFTVPITEIMKCGI